MDLRLGRYILGNDMKIDTKEWYHGGRLTYRAYQALEITTMNLLYFPITTDLPPETSSGPSDKESSSDISQNAHASRRPQGAGDRLWELYIIFERSYRVLPIGGRTALITQISRFKRSC